ncbi:MAG: SIS domain-containing protein [Anaerolineae bacterium]|nr:SIS domain-containing protein [Anaerolineae bacterium]
MELSSTYQEILTQLDAWRDALRIVVTRQDDIQHFWQQGGYEQVIFTGCGSTYYLALTAASLFQAQTLVAARAAPASELLLHPDSIYVRQKRTLLVAISRSGMTSETVQVAQDFVNQGRGEVLAVSCYSDKPLNQAATLNLVAHQGQEVSVAQTRSFSAMLVIIEQLTKLLAGESPQENFFASDDQRLIENALHFADQFTDSDRFQRYFYLGSGPRYGLAAEAMLKMKEMSLTSAEVFHPLEFRHGPKSMVDEETVVIGLAGEKGYMAELTVLKEMKALGATTISIGAMPGADYGLPQGKNVLVYTMPILQWLAHQRAVNKGLDPDRPRNLEQVVHLEVPNL